MKSRPMLLQQFFLVWFINFFSSVTETEYHKVYNITDLELLKTSRLTIYFLHYLQQWWLSKYTKKFDTYYHYILLLGLNIFNILSYCFSKD